MSDGAKKPPGHPPGSRRKKDVVLVHGITDDGAGVKVIRQRDDRLEAGSVVPVREGQPLHGDLVRLRPRPELPLLFDVEVEYEHPRTTRSSDSSSNPSALLEAAPDSVATTAAEGKKHVGPARAANKPFRNGWDRIWGRAGKKRLSN